MIDTRSAERLTVPNADSLSGLGLVAAVLHDTSVTLTFENTDRVAFAENASANLDLLYETIDLPLSTALIQQLYTVGRQGRVEVTDSGGRSRRLFVSRGCATSLAQIHLDYTRRVADEKASRAAKQRKGDARIYGAGTARLPDRREIVVFDASPVSVGLRYSTTVMITDAVVAEDNRLEIVVDFEGTQLLATWDSPDDEQLLMVSEAASMGRLHWAGIVGERKMNVKVELADAENFHAVMKRARGGLERRERRGLVVS